MNIAILPQVQLMITVWHTSFFRKGATNQTFCYMSFLSGASVDLPCNHSASAKGCVSHLPAAFVTGDKKLQRTCCRTRCTVIYLKENKKTPNIKIMQCFAPSCTLAALWRGSQIAFVFVHHWDSLWSCTTECHCHDLSCLLHDKYQSEKYKCYVKTFV